MQIDWTLLLLLVVAALGVLGLVIALQTTGGRKRLADAAMALAEALLRYAISWLEHDLPAQGLQATPDHAKVALAALRARRG